MKNILSVIPLSLTACLISASKIGATSACMHRDDPQKPVEIRPMLSLSTEFLTPAYPRDSTPPDVATVTTSIKTGYALETVAAMVFATQEESTVPFYRLVDPAISVQFLDN
ncbi:hypothetical protein K438DRAFT_1790055 [Mycena galopus ATCC 62051]|nr:hypothetical protein K438DRAFT_1790055 [Mycena galopus ATCC 62051]